MSPYLTLYLRAIEPSLRIERGLELAGEWQGMKRDEKAEYLTQCITPHLLTDQGCHLAVRLYHARLRRGRIARKRREGLDRQLRRLRKLCEA